MVTDRSPAGLSQINPHRAVVAQLQQAFAENWQETTGELLPASDFPGLATSVPSLDEAKGGWGAFVGSTATPEVTHAERLTQLMVRSARKRLWIAQAYFTPNRALLTMKEAPHLSRHPFGQIPTYEEDELVLFESGAIVFHIAQRQAGLLPDDANARARAITWMFAALSTVEPPIVELEAAKLLERDKPWYADRLPMLEGRVRKRLEELSARLGDAEWLDGAFSAGDLMMVTVLRRLEGAGILEDYPSLCAYVDRGKARPAYKRAFAAQLAVFTGAGS